MSVDKYLEKMVLVPIERWEQLLKNEKDFREDSDASDTDEEDEEDMKSPFPIVEKSAVKDSEDVIKDTDSKLAPPGVPSFDIKDIEEPEEEKKEEEYKPLKKKRKKHIKVGKTMGIFQWKKLP